MSKVKIGMALIAVALTLTLLNPGLVLAVEYDYGDAPEGGVAYPSTGTIGKFPTCITVGPAGWVRHTNFGTYFGIPGSIDFEVDGNAGLCPPGCFPPYDADECFQDGDAGLIIPEPYTILGGVVVTCPNSAGTALGNGCQTAVWGTNIDIQIHNFMPGHEPYVPAYVNVLIDWNQNGSWGGSSTCPGGFAPEHVLVNFVVPPQYDGTLSTLGPPNFRIGPKSGYFWVRFTISETSVPEGWSGEGSFEDGETEDYLLRVDEAPPIPMVPFYPPIAFIIFAVLIAITTVIYLIRKKIVVE